MPSWKTTATSEAPSWMESPSDSTTPDAPSWMVSAPQEAIPSTPSQPPPQKSKFKKALETPIFGTEGLAPTAYSKFVQGLTAEQVKPEYNEVKGTLAKITGDVSHLLGFGVALGAALVEPTPAGETALVAGHAANLAGNVSRGSKLLNYGFVGQAVSKAKGVMGAAVGLKKGIQPLNHLVAGGLYGLLSNIPGKKPGSEDWFISKLTNSAVTAGTLAVFEGAGKVVSNRLTPQVMKLIRSKDKVVRDVISQYIGAAILGGGFAGVMEPADTIKERAQNVGIGAAVFALQHGISTRGGFKQAEAKVSASGVERSLKTLDEKGKSGVIEDLKKIQGKTNILEEIELLTDAIKKNPTKAKESIEAVLGGRKGGKGKGTKVTDNIKSGKDTVAVQYDTRGLSTEDIALVAQVNDPTMQRILVESLKKGTVTYKSQIADLLNTLNAKGNPELAVKIQDRLGVKSPVMSTDGPLGKNLSGYNDSPLIDTLKSTRQVDNVLYEARIPKKISFMDSVAKSEALQEVRIKLAENYKVPIENVKIESGKITVVAKGELPINSTKQKEARTIDIKKKDEGIKNRGKVALDAAKEIGKIWSKRLKMQNVKRQSYKEDIEGYVERKINRLSTIAKIRYKRDPSVKNAVFIPLGPETIKPLLKDKKISFGKGQNFYTSGIEAWKSHPDQVMLVLDQGIARDLGTINFGQGKEILGGSLNINNATLKEIQMGNVNEYTLKAIQTAAKKAGLSDKEGFLRLSRIARKDANGKEIPFEDIVGVKNAKDWANYTARSDFHIKMVDKHGKFYKRDITRDALKLYINGVPMDMAFELVGDGYSLNRTDRTLDAPQVQRIVQETMPELAKKLGIRYNDVKIRPSSVSRRTNARKFMSLRALGKNPRTGNLKVIDAKEVPLVKEAYGTLQSRQQGDVNNLYRIANNLKAVENADGYKVAIEKAKKSSKRFSEEVLRHSSDSWKNRNRLIDKINNEIYILEESLFLDSNPLKLDSTETPGHDLKKMLEGSVFPSQKRQHKIPSVGTRLESELREYASVSTKTSGKDFTRIEDIKNSNATADYADAIVLRESQKREFKQLFDAREQAVERAKIAGDINANTYRNRMADIAAERKMNEKISLEMFHEARNDAVQNRPNAEGAAQGQANRGKGISSTLYGGFVPGLNVASEVISKGSRKFANKYRASMKTFDSWMFDEVLKKPEFKPADEAFVNAFIREFDTSAGFMAKGRFKGSKWTESIRKELMDIVDYPTALRGGGLAGGKYVFKQKELKVKADKYTEMNRLIAFLSEGIYPNSKFNDGQGLRPDADVYRTVERNGKNVKELIGKVSYKAYYDELLKKYGKEAVEKAYDTRNILDDVRVELESQGLDSAGWDLGDVSYVPHKARGQGISSTRSTINKGEAKKRTIGMPLEFAMKEARMRDVTFDTDIPTLIGHTYDTLHKEVMSKRLIENVSLVNGPRGLPSILRRGKEGANAYKDLSGNLYETTADGKGRKFIDANYRKVEYEQLNKILGEVEGGSVMVRKEMADMLEGLFKPTERGKLRQGFLSTKHWIKSMIFMNPAIYLANFFSEVGIEAPGMFKELPTILNPSKDISLSNKLWERAAEVNLATVKGNDIRRVLLDGLYRQTKGLKVKPVEILKDILVTKGGVDNWMWDNVVPKASMLAWVAKTKQYEAKGIEKSRAERLAAESINDFSGILPEHIYGSKMVAEMLNLPLFARSYNMAVLRQISGMMGYKGKGARGGIAHSSLSDKEISALQQDYIQHFGKMAFVYTATLVLAQYLSGNGTPLDNEKGHKNEMYLGSKRKNGSKQFLRPNMFRSYQELWKVGSFLTGDMDKALNKMTPEIRQIIEQVSNKNLFTKKEIRERGAPPLYNLERTLLNALTGLTLVSPQNVGEPSSRTLGENLLGLTGVVFPSAGTPGGDLTKTIWGKQAEDKWLVDQKKKERARAFFKGDNKKYNELTKEIYKTRKGRKQAKLRDTDRLSYIKESMSRKERREIKKGMDARERREWRKVR